MPKKDKHKDSTTDFFLNFITRQKEQSKESDKSDQIEENDAIGAKERTFLTLYKTVNWINIALDKLLSSSFSVKILSLVLTIILVFVINGGSIASIISSQNSGDVLKEVPITVEGLSNDYEVTLVQDEVNVMVVGPSLDITSLKITNNYEVFIDLASYGEGEHKVEVRHRGFPTSLDVTINPAEVTVRISPKIEKTFELGYRFINEDDLEKGLSVALTSMDLTYVDVWGAQDVIEKIETVEANIDLSGVNESFSQEAIIHAYDRSGQELNVVIEPETVQVTCEVSSFSKEVDIVPLFRGQMSDGYALSKVILSEPKVTIYGSEENLKSINEVYVAIDINDLSEKKTINNVALLKAEGINRMSVNQVNVTLEVEEAISKVIDDIPINSINNENNFNVIFPEGQDKVSIRVVGSKAAIDKLSAADIIARIDLTNITVGEHILAVEIVLPNPMMTYTFITSENLTVTIER